MPKLDKIVDLFIRARYSAWAGDLEHCRLLLNLIRSLPESSPADSQRWDSLGLILRSADQLRERLDVEASFLSPHSNLSENESASVETLLITTAHLRAVIHRVGDYDFELRGYLNDLAWESNLYQRASIVAARYPSIRERVREIRRRELGNPEESETRNPFSTWRMVEEDLIRTVSVGPFCLIKVKATWIREYPPDDFEEIRTPLKNVLSEIELGELPIEDLVESQQ